MYEVKKETKSQRLFVADDMILTKEIPTTAGSKMLEGYESLFEAEVVTKLENAGYELSGKAKVGEFAIDLLGETSFSGEISKEGVLSSAVAEIIKADEAVCAICLDVNGYIRRSAAQNCLISVKPTYGAVSRYGTVPVACSGETVSVMAKSVKECKEALFAIIGHDDKDGTSLPEDLCEKVKTNVAEVKKVAVLDNITSKASPEIVKKVEEFEKCLKENGVEVVHIDNEVVEKANIAWNILMCSELCNNVSRYDGVKYGYRTKNFSNIDELYTGSRTEAFGLTLKKAILFGSENLSTDNYFKVYDKALRVRRVITEEFAKIFEDVSAVIMPACSTEKYSVSDVRSNNEMPFEENVYTAPASITGLPCVVAGGVQIVGNAFSENTLFEIAQIYERTVR